MSGKIVQLKHVVFGITSNTHQQQYGCRSFDCLGVFVVNEECVDHGCEY